MSEDNVLNWREVSEESAERADEEERPSFREGVYSHEMMLQQMALAAKLSDTESGGECKSNRCINTEDDMVSYDAWSQIINEESPEPQPDPAAGLSFAQQHHTLSILILERLGGHLPVGVPIDQAIRYVILLPWHCIII